MFISNKYTELYYRIIAKSAAHQNSIVEKHHIVPKSLGGSNIKSNIAYVTPRQHFILHRCLVKMLSDPQQINKMRYALWRMMNKQTKVHKREYRITSRTYELGKNVHRSLMKLNNPMHNSHVVDKRTGIKRPNQSIVARKRNTEYWATHRSKLIIKQCKQCNSTYQTLPYRTRSFCNKTCSALYTQATRKKQKAAEAAFANLFGNKVD